jgi:hypothetical protein
LRRSPRCRNRIAFWASGCMPSSKPARHTRPLGAAFCGISPRPG